MDSLAVAVRTCGPSERVPSDLVGDVVRQVSFILSSVFTLKFKR